MMRPLIEMALVPVAFAVIVAVNVVLVRIGRRRVREALERSFAALRFRTPDGEVGGDAMRVVSIRRQGMPLVYDDVFAASVGPRQISDSFWYCVGPGRSYYLAIPMVDAGFGRVDVRWAVRPLTEERMRAALVDDPEAWRRASGAAIDA